MVEFTHDDEIAIDEMLARFFESSYALMTGHSQVRQLIQRLKAVEEKYEERRRLGEKRGEFNENA